MKRRQLFREIHFFCASLSALPLLAAGLTGTVLVFYKQAHHFVNMPHAEIEVGQAKMNLHQLIEVISETHPDLKWTGIGLPKTDDRAVQLWGSKGQGENWVVYADPFRGLVTAAYPTEELSKPTLIRWVTAFHYSLQAGKWGARLVGFSTIFLCFSLISGLYLWIPRTFRLLAFRLKPRRFRQVKLMLRHWHGLLGVYFGLGLLVVALTGMKMAFHEQLDPIIYWMTGTDAPLKLAEREPSAIKRYLTADEILQKASDFLQANYQGRPWPEYISFPTKSNSISSVYFQESDDLYNLTLSKVSLDAVTGEIVQSSTPESRNAGERFLDWVAVLHFGTWGDVSGTFLGAVGRFFWVLIALTPVFLVISGFMMWRRSEA